MFRATSPSIVWNAMSDGFDDDNDNPPPTLRAYMTYVAVFLIGVAIAIAIGGFCGDLRIVLWPWNFSQAKVLPGSREPDWVSHSDVLVVCWVAVSINYNWRLRSLTQRVSLVQG
jgi:hypothetical protein